MRATRIKPRVERALLASASLGSREESGKPTAWALDTVRRCSDAGPCGQSRASVTRSAGSTVVSRFPRVPLRASLRSALRFTLGFIRIARIRGLTPNPPFKNWGWARGASSARVHLECGRKLPHLQEDPLTESRDAPQFADRTRRRDSHALHGLD